MAAESSIYRVQAVDKDMGSGGSVSYVLQVILQCDFMQTMHSCEPGNSKVDLKSFGTCIKAKPPFDHLAIMQEVYFFIVNFIF